MALTNLETWIDDRIEWLTQRHAASLRRAVNADIKEAGRTVRRKPPAQQAQPETPPHRHKWVAGFNQRTGEWGEVCLICQRGRRIGRVR